MGPDLGGHPGAIGQSGISPDDIAAISITNQREATVVWDKNTGKPVCNAIVWQCMRTQDICAEWQKQQGWKQALTGEGRVKDITGLLINPYFSGTKIKLILDNVPGARERAEKGLLFGNMDTWLIWNLTGGPEGGVHVTDVSNASRTLLMNIEPLQWDKTMMDFLGIPEAMLPAIKPSIKETREKMYGSWKKAVSKSQGWTDCSDPAPGGRPLMWSHPSPERPRREFIFFSYSFVTLSLVLYSRRKGVKQKMKKMIVLLLSVFLVFVGVSAACAAVSAKDALIAYVGTEAFTRLNAGERQACVQWLAKGGAMDSDCKRAAMKLISLAPGAVSPEQRQALISAASEPVVSAPVGYGDTPVIAEKNDDTAAIIVGGLVGLVAGLVIANNTGRHRHYAPAPHFPGPPHIVRPRRRPFFIGPARKPHLPPHRVPAHIPRRPHNRGRPHRR